MSGNLLTAGCYNNCLMIPYHSGDKTLCYKIEVLLQYKVSIKCRSEVFIELAGI